MTVANDLIVKIEDTDGRVLALAKDARMAVEVWGYIEEGQPMNSPDRLLRKMKEMQRELDYYKTHLKEWKALAKKNAHYRHLAQIYKKLAEVEPRSSEFKEKLLPGMQELFKKYESKKSPGCYHLDPPDLSMFNETGPVVYDRD